MTRNQLNTYIAAILTTLADTGDGSAPESIVYMAIGMDMEKYETVRDLLLQAGLVTLGGDQMHLTPSGRELADKCNALLQRS